MSVDLIFYYRAEDGRRLHITAEMDGHEVMCITAFVDGDEKETDIFHELSRKDQVRIAAVVEDQWLANHDHH